jgi:hypothetical protein
MGNILQSGLKFFGLRPGHIKNALSKSARILMVSSKRSSPEHSGLG